MAQGVCVPKLRVFLLPRVSQCVSSFSLLGIPNITMDQHEVFPEALVDPESLVWQVLNAAWDAGIQVASENALPCYDRAGFNKTLENTKPRNDPDGRLLFGFTYLRLCSTLFEGPNFMEFERFVKRMHGEAVLDLQA